MSPRISRAGEWFLRSGIQESNGGVARYYRADLKRNNPVSTEITGYGIATLLYLHSLTRHEPYLERAIAAARFLTRAAWDAGAAVMPFELNPAQFTYFFDCGIIVRALLSVWRATGNQEFLDTADAIGRSMAADFAANDGLGIHPVLSLPGKNPLERDETRWSLSAGCYQLKAALAWWELADATGDPRYAEHYERALAWSLAASARFLPGPVERLKVMDRLHAFLYFLEGLLPRSSDRRCASALCAGIQTAAGYLHEIAPEFARSDVYAQLLRIRLYADAAGAAPLDRAAAQLEAKQLAEFQALDPDPRIDGGFYFGRRDGAWLPYVNPVSTGFALQALALWEQWSSGQGQPDRRLLI